ncbi:MAG: hypothetical protein GX451_01610 [Acholeplasmataceae bacterium]|nr:hypothetical protein [Acholeplasmataceae bacterium]
MIDVLIIIVLFLFIPFFLISISQYRHFFLDYLVIFPTFDLNLLTGRLFYSTDDYVHSKTIFSGVFGGFGIDLNGLRLVIWIIWLLFFILLFYRSKLTNFFYRKELVIYTVFLIWAFLTFLVPTSNFNWGIRFFFKLLYPILFFVIFLKFCNLEYLCSLILKINLLSILNVLFSLLIVLYRGDFYSLTGTHLGARGFNLHPFPYGFLLCNCFLFKLYFEQYVLKESAVRRNFSILLIIFGIIISFSRITWLIFIIIIVIYTFTRKRIGYFTFSLLILLLLFSINISPDNIFLDRIGINIDHFFKFGNIEPTGEGYGKAAGRISLWMYTIQSVMRTNLLYGYGLGGTESYYYATLGEFTITHNEFVRIFSEMGIVGLILFCIFILSHLFKLVSYRIVSQRLDLVLVNFNTLSMTSLFIFIVTFLTDNTLNYYYITFLPFLSLAIFSKIYEQYISSNYST